MSCVFHMRSGLHPWGDAVWWGVIFNLKKKKKPKLNKQTKKTPKQPKQRNLKTKTVSLLGVIKDGGKFPLGLKGNSGDAWNLLLLMWFVTGSVFLKMKQGKNPQKENRKINTKDRKIHLHIGQFLLPEEDSLLEEDKPRTQPVIPSEPRQAHVSPRTCKKTLFLAPALLIRFTAVLQKIPDWWDTPFETDMKSRGDLELGKQKELKSYLIN